MAFWADIDEDYVDEFREWHNCEHLTERVSIPGFRVGYRYCGLDGAHMFLMFYEVDSPQVLKSDAYLGALNSPTPWTKKSLGHFRNPVRTIYNLIASEGRHAPTEAPYLHVTRFDLDASDGEAWLRWYRDTYLPRLCAEEGVFRGRLYEVDQAISGIKTSEQNVHGAEPSGQHYCAMIEMADRAPGVPHGSAEMKDGRTNVVEGVYWLDFAMHEARRS